MKNKSNKKTVLILCLVVMAFFMFMTLLLSTNTTMTHAAANSELSQELSFTIHEVADNSGYIPSKNNQTNKFSNGTTKLGTLSVCGDGFSLKEWNGYQAIALTGTSLTFKYNQKISSSVDYNGHTWDLSGDTNNSICDYNVGEIGNGGIIVFKSFNGGSTWTKATNMVGINGTEVKFTPTGDDIAQGVLYKFVSVAEVFYKYQSGTYKNWHGPFYYTNDPVYDNYYTNLMQESIVYVASNDPIVGFYNEETQNYKLDLPKEVSEIEAEVIHKGVSLSDNGISTSSIKLDFLKNKSNYVEYSYNGSAFKKAEDGQILSNEGQYIIRVKTVFGTGTSYTLYVINPETAFKSYFGDSIVSQEKRIYNPYSKLPVYCKGSTYVVDAKSEFLPALYGSLSYFADEKTINECDAITTKWNGFHKFDGVLNKNGYYQFDLTTGDPNVNNGDIICFSMVFKVEDKGDYAPTVNEKLLTSSKRQINLKRTCYMAPMYTAGGGAYVFCFNDLKTAEEFSYQAELRFIEDFYSADGLYYYKEQNKGIKVPYNSKVELYEAVKKISKENVSVATIDTSLKYGVITFEEAVKAVETTSIKNDIYVISSIEERDKLCSDDIIINGFMFTSVADYEVNKVVAKNITTGEEFIIPFETVIDEVLPSVSAQYKITEYNWAGMNSYYVNFLSNNTTKVNISFTTEKGEEPIEIDSSNVVTVEAKDKVSFISALDELDSESFAVISKLGYIKIVSLQNLAGNYLDEEGEYNVLIKNRAGFSYSFNINISQTKQDVKVNNTVLPGIRLKSIVENTSQIENKSAETEEVERRDLKTTEFQINDGKEIISEGGAFVNEGNKNVSAHNIIFFAVCSVVALLVVIFVIKRIKRNRS